MTHFAQQPWLGSQTWGVPGQLKGLGKASRVGKSERVEASRENWLSIQVTKAEHGPQGLPR